MELRDRILKSAGNKKTLNYKKWFIDNGLQNLLEIQKVELNSLEEKQEKSLYGSVDPSNKVPMPPELDDLTRLHFIARNRKVATIMEFGVGKSTLIFADALKKNKEEYGYYILENFRRANPFQIHSIDNGRVWIEECKKLLPKEFKDITHFHFSKVEMTTFNGRICTMYEKLPNICPDLKHLQCLLVGIII